MILILSAAGFGRACIGDELDVQGERREFEEKGKGPIMRDKKSIKDYAMNLKKSHEFEGIPPQTCKAASMQGFILELEERTLQISHGTSQERVPELMQVPILDG